MKQALLVLAAILCPSVLSSTLWALPTTARDAELAVTGWLRFHTEPLDTPLGNQVIRTETFREDSGVPIYHVVYLHPFGYVIVSADDQVEPIVGFAAEGGYGEAPDDLPGALVTNDLSTRTAAVQTAPARSGIAVQAGEPGAREKWIRLWSVAQAPGLELRIADLSAVSDVRVAPLVKSAWSQGRVCNRGGYNLYTPYQYPAGCVAIAMAQVMRYHRAPRAPFLGNPVMDFPVIVDGVEQRRDHLRGGDGTGGKYLWDLLALMPDCSTAPAELHAIGALCYDAGLASGMKYAANGSATNLEKARNALLHTFCYAHAIEGRSNANMDGEQLRRMLNPNLDARLPVILGMRHTDTKNAHAAIVDGYGYIGFAGFETAYHHLNLGASGNYDLWYNLPDVDSRNPGPYNIIRGCLYNVFPVATGEIVSGRVLDRAGHPVSGVTVSTLINTDLTFPWRPDPRPDLPPDEPGLTTGPTTRPPVPPEGVKVSVTTDEKGIYAFIVVSDHTYEIQAEKPGYAFAGQGSTHGPDGLPVPAGQIVTMGTSRDGQAVCGNQWAVDFRATDASAAP
ncbi:MAG: C10 family peptidase [Planctomycetes bacterium]|nr:C10 family peptidase [Planctomycetota bacterium]